MANSLVKKNGWREIAYGTFPEMKWTLSYQQMRYDHLHQERLKYFKAANILKCTFKNFKSFSIRTNRKEYFEP